MVNLVNQASFTGGANVGKSKDVLVTFDVASSDSNYTLADAHTTATITPKDLTISAPEAADKVYDGTKGAVVTAGSLSGLVSTEELYVSATGTFADANAEEDKAVDVAYALADGKNNGHANNYRLKAGDWDHTTATIKPKALEIEGSVAKDKTYNASKSTEVLAGSLSGLVGNETLVVEQASGLFEDANAGKDKKVTASYTLADGENGGLQSNYSLADETLYATINPKALTISGSEAKDKVYDGDAEAEVTAGSLEGLVEVGGTAENLKVSVASAEFTGGANVGKDKEVYTKYTLANGESGGDLVQGLATNYTLADERLAADINPKKLTVSDSEPTTVASKVYDGKTDAKVNVGSLESLVGQETLTVSAKGAFEDANVGENKSVDVTYELANGGHGGLAANYTLEGETKQGTITKKALEIRGSIVKDKTYNASKSTEVLAGSLSGLVGNETLVVEQASGLFEDANAGKDKKVTASYTLADGENGGLQSNYSLADETLYATINPKALTISGSEAKDKVYDGDAEAEVTAGSLEGLVEVGGTAENLKVSVASAEFTGGANVGKDKEVYTKYTLANGESGGDLVQGLATNYTLADARLAADITPKTLTIGSPEADDKTYDGTKVAKVAAGDLDGLVTGETLNVSANGEFASTTAAEDKTVNVSYSLADGEGNGLAKNYRLHVGDADSTTATIHKKAVSVVGVKALDKEYNGSDAADIEVGGLLGLVQGDIVTVSATGTFKTEANLDATAAKHANSEGETHYVFAQYSLSGADAGNYQIEEGLEAAPLQATITPRKLGIAGVTVADKVYDGGSEAVVNTGGVTLSNTIDGETIIVSGEGVFLQGPEVGKNKEVQVAYSLDSTSDAVLASNFSLESEVIRASITPRPLKISGTTAANKVYDGTTEVDLSVGKLVGASTEALGVVSGETLDVSSSGSFETAGAGKDKTVNVSYTLSNGVGADGGLLGSASNYTLVKAGTATATIEKAPLTVKILNDSIIENSGYTPIVSYEGFVNGESQSALGGTLTYTPNPFPSDVAGSSVEVTPAGRTSENYEITYESGEIAVTPDTSTIVVNLTETNTPDVRSYTITIPGGVNGVDLNFSFEGTGSTSPSQSEDGNEFSFVEDDDEDVI